MVLCHYSGDNRFIVNQEMSEKSYAFLFVKMIANDANPTTRRKK